MSKEEAEIRLDELNNIRAYSSENVSTFWMIKIEERLEELLKIVHKS